MIKSYKIPVPSIIEQEHIIKNAEKLKEQIDNLDKIYQEKLANLEELKKSILHKAFAGEL